MSFQSYRKRNRTERLRRTGEDIYSIYVKTRLEELSLLATQAMAGQRVQRLGFRT
jgi:hypothetical protein